MLSFRFDQLSHFYSEEMGVELLAKPKRKLDGTASNDYCPGEKKSKHAKTSSNWQGQSFGLHPPSTVNPDQGKASASLAKLMNSSSKKSSIFESLQPLDTTVQWPTNSNQSENEKLQESSLSISTLGNKRLAKGANTASTSTASTSKSKKYKIVTNALKVGRNIQKIFVE